MQRWNDKLRPIELTEMDKQAHKMMIAFILGKVEQRKGAEVDWIQIIEGGIYEYLLRTVLTDIKPPIFYKIKEQAEEYKKLMNWAYQQWEMVFSDFEKVFFEKFTDYFSKNDENINRKILNAAHIRATMWEYNILEKFNSDDYEENIKTRLEGEYIKFNDLSGIKILNQEKDKDKKERPLTQLIDLCGQLRYQLRWAHIHRMPRTSVLGHLLFVAIITYLLSAGQIKDTKSCPKRLFNNFFTGLFHDLPEVLTRDIISPVKKSISGLSEIIKKEEVTQMNGKIIGLLPDYMRTEMKLFTGILPLGCIETETIGEFKNVWYTEGKWVESETDIPNQYNQDIYDPRDGELVHAADQLAAFIEAFVAIENGCSSKELHEALHDIRPKLSDQEEDKKPKKKLSKDIFQVVNPIYSEF